MGTLTPMLILSEKLRAAPLYIGFPEKGIIVSDDLAGTKKTARKASFFEVSAVLADLKNAFRTA